MSPPPLLVRVLRPPVLGDVYPSSDPHLASWLRGDVLHEPLQCLKAARLADDAAVETNGHLLDRQWKALCLQKYHTEDPATDHFGLPSLPFREQSIESALQVFEELLWREGACRAVELQVVIVVPDEDQRTGIRQAPHPIAHVYGTINIPSGFSFPFSAATSTQYGRSSQ